ncbi:MAG: phosphoribosyltransferase family protein [bacterium]
MNRILDKIKEEALNVLFPKICLNCGKEGDYVCGECSVFIGEAALICPVCNKSNFTGQRHLHCSARSGLDGLVNIWEYEGIIKEVFKNIKYKRVSHMAPEFTAKAFEAIAKDTGRFQSFLSFLFSENTHIAYVPMYKKKEKQRGFNQAKLIAEEMGKISGKKVVSLLIKTKETSSQTKLDKEARSKNLKDAFEYCEKTILPSQIVLVDDIWTTGATMRECCRILKKAGVQKIWGFTLVRTV